MLDNLIREWGPKLGLGEQARPLVQMLLAYVTNPATGGVSGFLDKFRAAGLGSLTQSWLGEAVSPQTPTTSQLESVLGGSEGLLSKLTSRLGLPASQVTSAVGALLPLLITRLTPGGNVPSVLPAEVATFARDGASLLGWSTTGYGGVAPSAAATPAVVEPTGGVGKWLPWVIAALVLLFGLNYCAKQKKVTETPPAAAVTAPQASTPPAATPEPAPVTTPEPASAPAPVDTAPGSAAPAVPVAPEPAAITGSAVAPEGAGVEDGMADNTPLLRVFFDSGKTDVAPEFAAKAQGLVDFLKVHPDVKAVISGFNDPTGDPAKNAELSKQRAQAVQAALVAAGVAEDRTVLEKPVDTTDTAASNAASRRVDVMLRK